MLDPLGDGKKTTGWEFVPARFVRVEHVQEVQRCRCNGFVVTAPGAEGRREEAVRRVRPIAGRFGSRDARITGAVQCRPCVGSERVASDAQDHLASCSPLRETLGVPDIC